jgi:hypothetical protein
MQWTADQTAGGEFEINFHEPGYACTNFGPGSSVLPGLHELVTGNYTWQGVPGNNFLPGCNAVSDPVNTTINYANMPIYGISIATGNPWTGPFQGYVDDLVIELNNNGATDTLVVDFEAEPLLNAPLIEKTFAPNPITPGAVSTLTFILNNPNNTPLSGLAFTDNFPAGLSVGTPANVTNTCAGDVTAVDGGTSVSLSGGYLAESASCTISVDTTAAATGDYINTTGELTTSTQRQFFEVGNTASDTLTVATVNPVYSSAPAPGSTIDLSGTAATNPQSATIDVSNIGVPNSLLDVSQVSITAGYNVTGLPINGLTPEDAPVTLMVSCDVPQAAGTLVVQTNEIDAPQYIYNLICDDTTPLPIYDSVPAPGSTIDLSGTAATNPQSATIDVSNIGDPNSLLDVSQVSITAGYNVTGLPINGLTPEDAPVTLTVSCDVPQAAGTLVVQTNEIDAPQYTYNLLCDDTTVIPTPEPTEPPPSDGGDPGDTGRDTSTVTDPLATVQKLPTTGETPIWRTPLILVIAMGTLLSLMGGVWVLRRRWM